MADDNTADTNVTAQRPDELFNLRRKRSTHAFVVNGLLPFVWPKDRPDLRRRVVLAAIVLVLAKIVTVLVFGCPCYGGGQEAECDCANYWED